MFAVANQKVCDKYSYWSGQAARNANFLTFLL